MRRVSGHVTPPWAVAATSATLSSAALDDEVEEALGVDAAQVVATEAGILDPAAGGATSQDAFEVVRARSAAELAHPDVFVGVDSGEVVYVNPRSAGLTDAQEHVEVFAQWVYKCEDWNTTTDSCDDWADDPTCFEVPTTNLTTTKSWPQLLGEDYIQQVEPEMLQHSSIIKRDAEESHCDELDANHWSWCDNAEPDCDDAEGEPICKPTARNKSYATTTSATVRDEVVDVFDYYYEWTARVGWDDEQANADYHRLRVVTDTCIESAEPPAPEHTICSIDDYATSGSPPGRWIDDGGLIALAIDSGNRHFVLAHEIVHGIDYSENNIKDSPGDPWTPFIGEGMADVLAVLWQAWDEDPDQTADPLAAPDWWKGEKCCPSGYSQSTHPMCDETGLPTCTCNASAVGYNFKVPHYYKTEDCDVGGGGTEDLPFPGHLNEQWEDCDGGIHRHAWPIIKAGQMLGGEGTDGEHTWHGVTVQTPVHDDTTFDYEDLTVLFLRTLKLMNPGDSFAQFRYELVDVAGTANLEENAQAAADSVGIWSLDTDIDRSLDEGSQLAVGRVDDGTTERWYAIVRTNLDRIAATPRPCDYDETCSWGSTLTLGTSVTTSPAATSVTDTDVTELDGEKIFVAWGGDNDELQLGVIDEDGTEDSDWPDPYDDVSATTDQTPTIARYGTDLYLFYKEAGSGAQDISALVMDLTETTVGDREWTSVSVTGTPLETAYGLAAASGYEDLGSSTNTPKLYVVYRDGDDEIGLWEFDTSSPDTADVTTAGQTYDQPTIVGQPFAAYFRGHLHVAAYRSGQDGAILYNRCRKCRSGTPECTGQDTDACYRWSHFWAMQGNESKRPAALSGYLPGAGVGLRLFHRTDGTGSQDIYMRSKVSD